MSTKSMTNLIYEAAVVKRMLRTGWQILGDNEEGVGGHTFMTAVIAYFLGKNINSKGDKKRSVNMEQVMVMSVFHDFHEARTGDLDKISSFYMTRDQGRANADIFKGIDDELLKLLNIYEARKTLEARLVYEANIIAFIIELKLLQEKGNVHTKDWIDANMSRLRIPETKHLVAQLISTSSQDWWKNIRVKLLEKFHRE